MDKHQLLLALLTLSSLAALYWYVYSTHRSDQHISLLKDPQGLLTLSASASSVSSGSAQYESPDYIFTHTYMFRHFNFCYIIHLRLKYRRRILLSNNFSLQFFLLKESEIRKLNWILRITITFMELRFFYDFHQSPPLSPKLSPLNSSRISAPVPKKSSDLRVCGNRLFSKWSLPLISFCPRIECKLSFFHICLFFLPMLSVAVSR
jgi:hypothetical protein